MSSTFLTVVVLAVMWTIVLLPVLIGRRSQVRESGSVERVATAIRVLARRSSVHRQVSEVADETDTAAEIDRHAVAESAEFDVDDSVSHKSLGLTSDSRMRAHARLIVRRRRTFVALMVSTVATFCLAWAAQGWAPVLWTLHLMCDVLLLGYAGWLRKEVKRQRVRRLRREHAARSVARSFGTDSRRNVHSGQSRVESRAGARATERDRVRHQQSAAYRVALDDEDPSLAEFDFDRHGRAANY